MAPTSQVNSATLIIGQTGSGKSSLARTLADYLWETWKKKLYYYNCDGGGFPARVQEGIALGIIKGFKMRTRDPSTDLGLAFETCSRAAMGWWPRRINPVTCEVEPGVEMVPPIAKRIQMICPNGHVVKAVVATSQLSPQPCPTCQVLTTTQNMTTQTVLTHSKGFEDRGGVFFDGLSSMLSWETMELGQRAGRMELGGEEGAIGGKVISGQLRYGGVTRSHIGFVQMRGEELCHLTMGIPGLLVPPVFTALTDETTDEGALSIVGPKIAGHAKTGDAPQWVGNCVESAKRPNPNGAGEQFVLYLEEFTDQRGRKHLIKHRGSPGTMPAELADPPNGIAPFSNFNLGVFYKKLDEALQAGIAQAKLQIPDAPGVQEGIEEFGDGGMPAAPLQMQQAAVPPPQGVPAGRPTTLQAPPPGQQVPPAQQLPLAQPATPATAPAPPPAAPKPRSHKAKAPAAPPSTPPVATPAPATPPAAQQAGPPTPIAQPAAPAPSAPATPAPAPAPPAAAAPARAAVPPPPIAPAAPVAAPVVPATARPAGIAPPPGVRPPAAQRPQTSARPPAPPAAPKA